MLSSISLSLRTCLIAYSLLDSLSWARYTRPKVPLPTGAAFIRKSESYTFSLIESPVLLLCTVVHFLAISELISSTSNEIFLCSIFCSSIVFLIMYVLRFSETTSMLIYRFRLCCLFSFLVISSHILRMSSCLFSSTSYLLTKK